MKKLYAMAGIMTMQKKPVPMKLVTWNVNSVRQRLPHLLEWVRQHAPDVVLLQETKCVNDQFPAMELEELGYNLALHGQKTFNGVAILSRYPLSDIITALPNNETDEQCRYIEAVVSLPQNQAMRVASVYVPNGQAPDSEKFAYKLQFLEKLHAHLATLLRYEEVLVVGGDYNIAPEALDVFNPQKLAGSICFHPDERAAWRRLIYLGFYDAFRMKYPNLQQFSWWDYRAGQFDRDEGLRIDHLLLSPQAADILQDCGIDVMPRRAEKASDHAPVWCALTIN
jgi:exodeoxyribonuclease-3